MGRHPRAALRHPNTNILPASLNLEPSSGNTPRWVARGKIEGDVRPALASCAQRKGCLANIGRSSEINQRSSGPSFRRAMTSSRPANCSLRPPFGLLAALFGRLMLTTSWRPDPQPQMEGPKASLRVQPQMAASCLSRSFTSDMASGRCSELQTNSCARVAGVARPRRKVIAAFRRPDHCGGGWGCRRRLMARGSAGHLPYRRPPECVHSAR
jgi:hypothetical protein